MLVGLSSAVLVTVSCATMGPSNPMTFFVTSTGSGQGANLGGLSGADALCDQRAASVGAAGSGRTWHAYLSTQPANGQPAPACGCPTEPAAVV